MQQGQGPLKNLVSRSDLESFDMLLQQILVYLGLSMFCFLSNQGGWVQHGCARPPEVCKLSSAPCLFFVAFDRFWRFSMFLYDLVAASQRYLVPFGLTLNDIRLHLR